MKSLKKNISFIIMSGERCTIVVTDKTSIVTDKASVVTKKSIALPKRSYAFMFVDVSRDYSLRSFSLI